MTEYWVSQGNKWCDFCKIFISSNPASIRNHELGQRHKESVAQRLNTMREQKVTKDKELKQAARAIEQIEAKAKSSYQKDVANFEEARDSNLLALEDAGFSGDWEHDSSSGYYYNQTVACYYDPNSGFYYTEALGKWVPQVEALGAVGGSSGSSVQKKPLLKRPPVISEAKQASDKKMAATELPGPVVTTPPNPKRGLKGAAPSSLTLNNKRKRPEEKKPKKISEEEAAALKAREAAKKRVEEREKSLLGLYKH